MNQKGQKTKKKGKNCITFAIVVCFAIEASKQASKQVADLFSEAETYMGAHTHS